MRRKKKITSRADSNDHKFCLLGLPAIFASKEDALASKKDLEDYVEDVVKGNCPLRSRAVAAMLSMLGQLQASL